MHIFLKSMAIVLSFIAGLHAMDREANYNHCPTEIKPLILTEVVKDNYIILGSTEFLKELYSLKSVCKEWNGIISKDFARNCMHLACGEMCPEFLNGKLIYRPNEGSDVGMLELLISELWNPLEGAFDLSKCGDTGKHLSIWTGYRKGKKAENENKLEIWFAPRFVLEKEIMTTAAHFQAIYNNWNESAPVGIVWTWGGWDDLSAFNHLTNENMDNLSKINLHQN